MPEHPQLPAAKASACRKKTAVRRSGFGSSYVLTCDWLLCFDGQHFVEQEHAARLGTVFDLVILKYLSHGR